MESRPLAGVPEGASAAGRLDSGEGPVFRNLHLFIVLAALPKGEGTRGRPAGQLTRLASFQRLTGERRRFTMTEGSPEAIRLAGGLHLSGLAQLETSLAKGRQQ
jgi:hypothetical protein